MPGQRTLRPLPGRELDARDSERNAQPPVIVDQAAGRVRSAVTGVVGGLIGAAALAGILAGTGNLRMNRGATPDPAPAVGPTDPGAIPSQAQVDTIKNAILGAGDVAKLLDAVRANDGVFRGFRTELARARAQIQHAADAGEPEPADAKTRAEAITATFAKVKAVFTSAIQSAADLPAINQLVAQLATLDESLPEEDVRDLRALLATRMTALGETEASQRITALNARIQALSVADRAPDLAGAVAAVQAIVSALRPGVPPDAFVTPEAAGAVTTALAQRLDALKTEKAAQLTRRLETATTTTQVDEITGEVTVLTPAFGPAFATGLQPTITAARDRLAREEALRVGTEDIRLAAEERARLDERIAAVDPADPNKAEVLDGILRQARATAARNTAFRERHLAELEAAINARR